jgi:DNA mismatch repair protein MutS
MGDHTPVMQQYLAMKQEHGDAVLFFRMGDFYEMFFEDAKLAARVLGITLTTRDKNKKDPIPMAGIPYHALNGYLTKMLRAGYKVAICEQTSEPGKGRGPVRREVVQVVTPGTVMGDEVLEAGTNNFLACLSLDDGSAGIAVVDLSTGEFRAGELPPERDWLDELERIGPAEILLSENEPQEVTTAISSRLGQTMITTREGFTFDPVFATERIREHFKVAGLKGFGIEDTKPGVAAAGGALAYLIETQKASLDHITAISRYRTTERMFVDARTLKNLEIVSPLSDDSARKHTLIGVVDRTRTPMGGRLLRQWLTAPLLDPEAVNERLDGVEELNGEDALRDECTGLLDRIRDVERLITRVCLDRATPRDMVALADSLACSWELRELLGGVRSAILTGCASETGDLRDIAGAITDAIVDDPPATVSDGGMFRDGINSELDELRDISRSGRRWIAELQESERNRTGIQTLKIKYNNVFGYFIEISNSNKDRVPEDYHRKQTLVNAERFITPELKEYEAKVLGASERIAELERGLFVALRKDVAARVRDIQAFSRAVAVLDVLRSFAEIARERGYVRPTIAEGTVMEIRDGRHPVVEELLASGTFVSNDTYLHGDSDQVLIITGPNMAGKSTYLRQVGIIVLMAQAGAYVPASSARIGIVDRIFTRVGAADNLAGGESTFLVEMNETANILNNCSPRSLILFDEVGRGTSTFDGLSIAWSIIEYLHETPGREARTLFATHYHELTELAALFGRVKNYNVAVKEWNDEIIFLRRIMEGGSDQSLGIQVARLAGLPPDVISRAKEILANLEANEFTVNDTPRIAATPRKKPEDSSPQTSLFALPEHAVVRELKELNIDNLTPLKALLLLDQFKRKAEE